MSSRQAATCCQLRCATSKSAAVVVPDSSGGEKNNTTSGATERRDDIGSCELGSSSSISFIFVLFHHLPLIHSSNHLTKLHAASHASWKQRKKRKKHHESPSMMGLKAIIPKDIPAALELMASDTVDG